MAEFLPPEKQREARDSERLGGKIFVGNIRKDSEKDEIDDFFSKFGEVLSIWIAKQPPGFCFVTFRDPDDAKKAVEDGHGKDAAFAEENGRGLRVEVSTYAEKKRNRRRGGDSRRRSRSRGRGGRRDSRGRGGRRDSRGGRDDSRGRGRDRRR